MNAGRGIVQARVLKSHLISALQRTILRGISQPGEPMALKILNRNEAFGYAPGHTFIIKTRYSRMTVIGGTCNDGMSDEEYTYNVAFEHDGKLFGGCCTITE
jgi:hypothetical protein